MTRGRKVIIGLDGLLFRLLRDLGKTVVATTATLLLLERYSWLRLLIR